MGQYCQVEMFLGAVVGLVVDGAYVEVEFQGFEGFLHGPDDIVELPDVFLFALVQRHLQEVPAVRL